MTSAAVDNSREPWPRLWRMVVMALCTLILCSCRAPRPSDSMSRDPISGGPSAHPPALPPHAFTGALAQPQAIQPSPNAGVWSPPGITGPWPRDEYLADGGDAGLPAEVAANWRVNGLEQEDTIAHFDTLDGRTLIEPSNRVHIYSPRFGAVRQVVSLVQNEQMDRSAGVYLPTGVVRSDDLQIAATSAQNIQADRQIALMPPASCRTKQGDGAMSSVVKPLGAQDAFQPLENLVTIGQLTLEESESAWLAKGATAAIAWSHKQAVQVVLDHQGAMATVSDNKVETVYTVKAPPGDPKLRVIKTASKQFAEPGETVEFAIRFDNVGNQPIGNVTIIDNLSTRLEYVADSYKCTLDAQFMPEPNVGQSLALRWEFTDPLRPGQGGLIRFICRVR